MNLSQRKVNDAFIEYKADWDKMVADSGKSEKMFIATDSAAAAFLADYQQAKEHIESLGLEMPVLVEGLTITVTDAEE